MVRLKHSHTVTSFERKFQFSDVAGERGPQFGDALRLHGPDRSRISAQVRLAVRRTAVAVPDTSMTLSFGTAPPWELCYKLS
ncbi:hypothetical protein GCM10009789_64120 [Kribbella sancticallisti]|uniref:Uncharacterized protein n=1 Tax=Kribbella sancticallisti TaxID=460087 RepID=A0ABN2EAM9_9ACTN